MKKFIKLIPVFLLFCLTSITVKAQDSTSLCLEELNTDVYEDILTEYYEVETGYAYCSSAVNLTSSVEITEDVSVTILDAYGSNVWRVDTSLETADSNCTVVELNNNFYYLSAVSNAVFTDEGVTFSTNKLGIYIAGGCFSEEDIENFSAGTSNFNIENNAIWTDASGKAYYAADAVITWDISKNEDGTVMAYLFDTDADTVGDTVVLDGVGETVGFNAYVKSDTTISDNGRTYTINSRGFGYKDESYTYYAAPWALLAYKANIKHFYITNTSNVSFGNAKYLFYNLSNLESVDFNNASFSEATTMYNMFCNCSLLTTLDLSNFNTSKVTDMGFMFSGCSSLESLDLSNFNTSNVTTMKSMFSNCKSLTTLNLSNFDTSSVTYMRDMFYECNSLITLDLSSFETSNVDDIRWMFGYCKSLTSLDLSNFDTSNVTNMIYMFYGCNSLSILDLSNFDTSNVTNMSYMFKDCRSLTTLDLSNFNTSNVTDMQYMFDGCSGLTSLNISNFNTSNVTNMSYMFYDCTVLTTLDVDNFDTSKATDIIGMFRNCNSLTSLDLSNFDTSKVTEMTGMFNGCSSLTSLDISNFDTSNVTTMWSMFNGCSSLATLNINSFDTSRVTNMNYMFNNCSSLTSLDLSGFNMSAVTGYAGMFTRCTALNKVILPINVGTCSVNLPKTFYGYAADDTRPDQPQFYTVLPAADASTRLYYISSTKYTAIEALLRDTTNEDYFLGVEHTSFKRENIASVNFITNSTLKPNDAVDVSLIGDEGVFAYSKASSNVGLYDIYIVTKYDKIYTNANADGGAKYLFKGLYNCNSITGFEYLDLSRSSTAEGMFSVYAPETFVDPIIQYAHSSNVDDMGNSTSSTYRNNLKEVKNVSFPGAAKLEIVITTQTESTSYDFVAIYPGDVTPAFTSNSNNNLSEATVSNGKIGGTTKTTKSFTYEGDSVNIFFRTDGSGNRYYGYYAVITAYDADGNVLSTTVNLPKKILDLSNLNLPEGINTTDFFTGCTNFTSLRTPTNNSNGDIALGTTMYTIPDNTAYNILPVTSGTYITLYESTETNSEIYCNKAETIYGVLQNETLSLHFVQDVDESLDGCYDLDIPLCYLFYVDDISTLDMSNIDGCLSICDGFAKNITLIGSLNIPDSVTTIGSYAFENAGDATGELHLPSALVTLGSYAFKGCSFNNTNLIIPEKCISLPKGCFYESSFESDLKTNKVTTVGEYCFAESNFNGDVDLEGVVTIKESAFNNISTDGYLMFSDSLSSIENCAFKGASGFKGDLVIPGTVHYLSPQSFCDCTNSWVNGELWLNEGLISIPYECFKNCTGLIGDITIPDSCTSLGTSCFENIHNNGKLTLGYGITSLPNNAFKGSSFETIILKGKLRTDCIFEGAFLFNADVYTGDVNNVVNNEYLTTTVYCHVDDITARNYDWHNNAKRDVTFIDLPYYLNTSKTLVGEINDTTLSIIGEGTVLDIPIRTVFGDRYNTITTLDWSQAPNITTIGKAWALSTHLTGDLVLPDTITEIQSNAFYSLNSFTGELHLPQNLQTIGDCAFYNCRSFTGDIIIPVACTTIGEGAFQYVVCTGDVVIPDTCTTLKQGAFYNSEIGGDVYIGKGIKVIPDHCFYHSTIGGNIVINAEIIGSNAFCGSSCNGTLDLGDCLKEIGDSAFQYVSNYTGDLIIPGTVEKMGQHCFCKPKSSTWVGSHLIIEDGCQVIGFCCFNNCDGFVGDIIIPDSVKRIEGHAFLNGSNTDKHGWIGGKLQLGKNIEYIGESAFGYLNLLDTDVIIPESCSYIGDYAFTEINSLGTLKLSKNITTIYPRTFESTYFNNIYFENDYALDSWYFYFYNSSRRPVSAEYLSSDDSKLLTTVHCSHNHTNIQSVNWESMYNRVVTYDFYDKYLNTAETILGRIMDDGTLNIYYDISKDSSIEGYNVIDKTLVSVFGEDTKNITNIVFDDMDPLTLCDSWCDNREVDFPELLGVYNLNGDNIYGAYCFADCQNTLFVNYFTPDNLNKPAEGSSLSTEYLKEVSKHTLFLGVNSSVTEGSFMNCYQINSIFNKRYNYQDGVQDWYNAFSCNIPMSTKILYDNVADDTNMQGYKYWSTVGRYPVYFVEDSENTNPIVYCISTLQKECKVIAFEENTVLQSKLSDLFDGIQYTTSDFDLFDKVLFESDSSDSYINWYLDLMSDVYTLSHVTCIPDGWAMSAKINYIELPEQCVSIGKEAFYNSKATNSLNFPTTLRNFGENAFQLARFTGDLNIPEGVTSVPNLCFSSSKFDGTLSLPSTVTEIGQEAFWACKFTGNLVLPSALNYLGEKAFYDCNKLKGDLVIPEGITNLPKDCFSQSGFNGTLELPNNIVSIGDDCFNNVYIKLYNWPSTLQILGANCLNRATIYDGKLPKSLTTIGDGAFKYSNFMDFKTVPENVQSVGSAAFGHGGKIFWLPTDLEISSDMFDNYTLSERACSVYIYTPVRKSFDWTNINHSVSYMNDVTFSFPEAILLKPKYISGKDAPIWTTTFDVSVYTHFTKNSFTNILEAVDFYVTDSTGKKVLVDVDYTPIYNLNNNQLLYYCDGHSFAKKFSVTLTAEDLSLVDQSTGELKINYELHEMIPSYAEAIAK